MNTKNNQRYQDTEQNIQQTLLELAHRKDIRTVTVRAICEEAGINRSTFYAHYLDINDLVDQMGRTMMHDIGHMFDENGSPLDFFTSAPLLTQMIAYVKEHKDFFDIYLNHYSSYANESFSLLWESFVKPYATEIGVEDENEMWYYFTFFKAGFLSVLSQWLQRDCPETPDRLAEILIKRSPIKWVLP